MIGAFATSGTGNNDEADLADILFGFRANPRTHFSDITSDGTASAATGFLPGRTFLAGSIFSVFFTDGITDPVGVTLSFRTNPVAAVPLPAAGILMMPFLLVGGIAAWWRRRKTTQLGAV